MHPFKNDLYSAEDREKDEEILQDMEQGLTWQNNNTGGIQAMSRTQQVIQESGTGQ